MKIYKNLFNIMTIISTEQTSTFPCSSTEIEKQLKDNLGLTWKLWFDQFNITKENIPFILHNVITSMFNDNSCYVYTQAVY